MDIEQYLKNFYAGTKDPSLTGMKFLLKNLGNPEKNLEFIHIAGTNGKGSIAEMLSQILIKAGYRTGKFMSPHLVYYNERMSINNQPISDKEMEKLILECKSKVEQYNQTHETPITLFELETTMALLYFQRNHCDLVVLETGLGGLYDCTNVVEAKLSVISSIGFDHMNLLGDTLSQIATQKAGIIKENGDTVFVKQEPEVNQIIEKVCQQKNSKCHEIKPEKIVNLVYGKDFTKFDYQNHKNIEINLKGEKQPQNAVICLECIEILRKRNYPITDTAIKEGLKTVVHKGRFETICQNPKIIFDGAHNEPTIEHLKHTIDLYFKEDKKVFIVSILRTKDEIKILEKLLQEEAIFLFTSGNDEGDYVSKEELYETARKINSKRDLQKQELRQAIALVCEKYRDCVTFVIGSFYVYATVIQEIEEEKNDRN